MMQRRNFFAKVFGGIAALFVAKKSAAHSVLDIPVINATHKIKPIKIDLSSIHDAIHVEWMKLWKQMARMPISDTEK